MDNTPTRVRISLDGEWQFQIDPDGTLTPERITAWRTTTVPTPWQAQFDDLRNYSGVAWYQRVVTLPPDWPERPIYLRFGAVDYFAEVWVNGERVGEHEGGYLPFEFEIDKHLRPNEDNLISVRVLDPGPEDEDGRFPFSEIPHGKQSWYGPLGGLWQSVTLESRPLTHFMGLKITPNLPGQKAHIEVRLAGEIADDDTLQLTLFDPDRHPVAQIKMPAAPLAAASMGISDPVAWSPDHPALYRAEAILLRDGKVVDRISEQFGMRHFEARNGRFYLNGNPLFLRMALDQDYYPRTIATSPSEAFLRDQFTKAKAAGLNGLRYHIKIADPRYLALADEMGLLIWADLPNWIKLTPAAEKRAWETMKGMIERDYNHPSIIIWNIVNEDWGTDLVNSPADRSWLAEMFAKVKQLDATRLVVDNSPCPSNIHVVSDIEDYHLYHAFPDKTDLFKERLAEFAVGAEWTYGPESQRSGGEPLVVSEFGNWGLPDPNALVAWYGEKPWWFDTGKTWGEGAAHPDGMAERFEKYHLHRAFGDFKSLIRASQEQELMALKYQIEAMRAYPQLAGYVITEFTDVHWEANGILDICRQPKFSLERLAQFNAVDVALIPDLPTAVHSGDLLQLPVVLSRYSAGPASGGQVAWSLEPHDLRGELPVSSVPSGNILPAGEISFTAPDVERPSRFKLHLDWRSADGSTVATNEYELLVLPQPAVEKTAATITTNDPDLAEWLGAKGYQVNGDGDGKIVIFTQWNEAEQTFVQDGGKAILLAETLSAPMLPGVELKPRDGSVWEGNWLNTLHWLRPDVVSLTNNGRLDMPFTRVTPKQVLDGLSPSAFADDVIGGLYAGWIHKPVATTVRLAWGDGQVLLTTLQLRRGMLNGDIMAASLFDELLNWFKQQ